MATAPNLTITLNTRQPVNFADIEPGDLVDAVYDRGGEESITRRIRVNQKSEDFVTDSRDVYMSSCDRTWYLVDRPLKPAAAERARIADILDEQVRLGAAPRSNLTEREYAQFMKSYQAIDQRGTMTHLSSIADWIRGGAVFE